MLKGYPSSQKGAQNYQTLQPLGNGKHGADAIQRAYSDYAGVDLVPEATSTGKRIDLAGHSVKAGDMIRFVGGTLQGTEVSVVSVETNSIVLAHDLGAIAVTDLFRNYRSTTLTLAQDGSIPTSQGPVQFNKDGGVVEVTRDTVTPSNNAPLPVEIIGAAGQDINITAGDINVQTSHLGTSFDSQRIGDGTNIMAVSADLEAQVHDPKALIELQAIKAAVEESAKQEYAIDSVFFASQLLNAVDFQTAMSSVGQNAIRVEISYKNGDPIAVYTDGSVFLGFVTSGGGSLPLKNFAPLNSIYLRRAGASDFTATDLVVTLIGKDV